MKYALLFLLVSGPLCAGVGSDLARFFGKLGGAANVTNPGATHDQTGGYYTGGNLFARGSVHTSQLASVQLPGYRAGCGGIDMFLGAFSHISSEKLIEALKAIGSGVASYALLLAIETMSPQIKNIITELNDLVQKINQSNINSCEIAATTLGAVWPKSDAAQGHLCKMIGSEGRYGGFSDYAAARQECGAGGKREGVLRAGRLDPKFKSMLGDEFNLAWKAIQENAFLAGNRKLSEFFMSVSGTLIARKDKGGGTLLETKVSLADKESLLSALLYGGEVRIYRCGDEGCLTVSEVTLTIGRDQCLVEKVREMLSLIQGKIYADEPLSEAGIAFLNSTRLPFYKILSVATAYRRGGSPVDVLDYAEIGAVDMLFQYLSEILDVVQESVDHLKLSQVDDAQVSRFQKSLSDTRARITSRKLSSFKQIEQVAAIVSKTELLEKSLFAKVSAMTRAGG